MRRLAALLLVAGCHGGLSPQAYPGELAKAICAPEAQCRKEAAWQQAACEEEALAGFVPDLSKALAAHRVQFDAVSAQACLDGLAARGCEQESVATAIACSKALTGLVEQGATCNWRFECAGTYCVEDKTGACPGTCGAAIPRGGPCGDSVASQCDRSKGLRCIASVCSELHGPGEDCTTASDCRADLFCDANAGTCVARANENVVCAEDGECSPGLYCRISAAGGLCEKQAAAGQPCGEDADHAGSVDSQCAPGLVCAGFKQQKSAPVAGACTAAAEAGGACFAGADITGCAHGLVCANGRCALATVGTPCQSGKDDNCAQGQYCDDPGSQTCKEAHADGEACTSHVECTSRYCDVPAGKCAEPRDSYCHEP